MTREELERLWHLLVYQSGEPLKDGLAVIVNDKSDKSTYACPGTHLRWPSATPKTGVCITVVVAIINWWKNNSFTKEAIEADELFARLRAENNARK